MNGWRRLLGRFGAVVGATAVLLVGPGMGIASAHPLGNFTVNRYTGALVSPDHILLDHVFDFAEIPTAQFGDQTNDLGALATRECHTASHDLAVAVEGRAVTLRVLDSKAELGDGQAGLPVLGVQCLLRGDFRTISGDTQISVVDRAAGHQIGWNEMTARSDGTTLVSSDVATDSVSARLSSYPKDLLSSPLDQRSASLVVRLGGPAGSLESTATRPTATAQVSGVNGLTERVAGLLDHPGIGMATLTLVAAVALGAAHALAPGHGKTVMAFYLVDQRRRSWRSAAVVGSTVTLSHTASVLALGLLVTAGSPVVPDTLYPWLKVLSGLLILVLGVTLLRGALRGRTHSHDHGHGLEHGHDHEHGHGHSHEHASTAHTAPGRGSVLSLGIAGGLVPSPSALILLLVGVQAGRPWFGAVAVLAFGMGMALTLCLVGLMASGLTQRVELLSLRSGRWARTARIGLSYGAASGVCLVGAGLVLRATLTI
jgi:nickel/cobalt transporter (NicO) family protein